MFGSRLLVATILLSLFGAISAAPYEDELLLIEIPTRFQGPTRTQRSFEGLTMDIVVYVKTSPADTGTLLQITKIDLGSKLPKLDRNRLGKAAENYLLQFLGGVERRRTDFQASTPTRIDLDGLPGARVTWKGAVPGDRLLGTMYCVIVGSRVIAFHTQQSEDAPREHTAEAVRAIESVRFKHDG